MIQIIIVITYVLLTFLIGWFSNRKTKNSQHYDGVKMGLLMCVVAGAGEWSGGTSTTGVSEYGFTYGMSGAWYTIANGIGICFLAFFFARLFRSLETTTVSGIIGKYIGNKARMVSSIVLIFVMLAVGASQLVAIGTLGQTLFGLQPTISILLLGIIITIYTAVGGMNAVGNTNAVHLLFMYGGMILALVMSLRNIGGMQELKLQLPQSYFSMTSIGTPRVLSWIIASVLGACTAQAGLQPILGAESEKVATKASYLIAMLVAPFGIITVLLGMIAKVQFPQLINAKLALPELLMSLPPFAGGVVMAALFAAILSTASPIFLACGTLFTRDIYLGINDESKMLDCVILKVARTATIVAGVCCIICAVLFSGSAMILDIVYFAYSIRGSLFIVLLLGIFWKRTAQKSSVIAMIATCFVGFFWVGYKRIMGVYPIHPAFSETYISIIVTAGIMILGSNMEKRKTVHRLDEINTKKDGIKNMKSVIEYVADYAAVEEEKVAVIDGNTKATYKELFDMACKYSKYLKDSGAKKGDIVVLRASQDLNYVILYLGIHLAGCVVSSVEKGLSDEGMLSVARLLNARIIITDDFGLKEQYDAYYISRTESLEQIKNIDISEYNYVFPQPEDSADILFTTGTTGASKGVELSHRALVATAENLIYGCEYKKDTVLIVPGPMNHANPIRKLFTTLVNGSTICILDGLADVKGLFKALENLDGKVACCLPPAAIRTIFILTKNKIGDYADKIDFIESASAPLPESDKLKLCKLLPNTRLYNNYGSSEAASVCMYDYNKYPGKEGCIGKEMPNSKIIIVDEEKNIIGSSIQNIGMIACVGDVNMKGYVNEPLLTKEVLVDGVVYTNDVGYKDEEGFVYVIGRKGDVINVGGLKVAPAEIEDIALSYDGINDCICIPIEDRLTGKAVKLLVVVEEGKKLDKEQMLKFLQRKLETYKVPRYIEQTDFIKRTYNGKLDRKAYF